LEEKGEEMSSCLFEFIGYHLDYILQSEALPFFKEMMLSISENLDVNKTLSGVCCGTPLIVASRIGAEKAITKLIERGANTELKDIWGWTALHRAAHAGKELSCKALLENGANVHARCKLGGATPKRIAAEAGHVKVEQILFEFETKSKKKNSTDFCKII